MNVPFRTLRAQVFGWPVRQLTLERVWTLELIAFRKAKVDQFRNAFLREQDVCRPSTTINAVHKGWQFHILDIVMHNTAGMEPLNGRSQGRKPRPCSPFVYFNLH